MIAIHKNTFSKGYDSICYLKIYYLLDIIMSFIFMSSAEIAKELAARSKSRRLAQNLTLEGLAQRSGVALGTLKKYERTGQISLVSFIRLGITLRDEAALDNLLLEEKFETLDEVLQSNRKRKRGRIK